MTREKNTQMTISESFLPLNLVDFDPELDKIDQILDENPIFLTEFTRLMEQRHKNSRTLGRRTQPAEVLFRMLLLRRTRNLSLRETEKQVKENLVFRKFTRVYYDSVPDYSTLCRYDNLVTEEFLKKLNAAIIDIARKKSD